MRRLFVALSLSACADPGPSDTKFTDGGEDTLATPGVRAWRFDEGMPPELFKVLGDWVVRDGELVQAGSFAGPDFPRMLVQDLSVTDFHLSVKCRSASGGTDRACGLLFRAVDSENYYVTRANALENNIRLYHVVDGQRVTFASVDANVDGNYHQLAVDARGTHIEVSWDGSIVIRADDEHFARGAIGVWTKADSKVQFDDLVLEVP